jgi:hypothetical protein
MDMRWLDAAPGLLCRQVRPKNTRADEARLLHADEPANALQRDMPPMFRLVAANYFGRVSHRNSASVRDRQT